MGSILSKIDTYIEEYFDYGKMIRCPNCNNRTILSYPSTVCTKCQNCFRNDIVQLAINNRFNCYGHLIDTANVKYGKEDEILQPACR
jgi:ribosomal protein S27E